MTNYVSLGSQCSVAYHLKRLNLSQYSYPFDWCKLNIKKLINVLENNFQDFSIIKFKKYSLNHKYLIDSEITNINSIIIQNKYGIEFAHEITEKYEISEFQNKLIKRIERFKNLKNPIFIRIENQNLNKDKMLLYKKLENILKKYFQNFKILLISYEKYETDITKWFKLENFSPDWKYNNVSWEKILLHNYFSDD